MGKVQCVLLSAKFDIYHRYSVGENRSGKVSATYGHSGGEGGGGFERVNIFFTHIMSM